MRIVRLAVAVLALGLAPAWAMAQGKTIVYGRGTDSLNLDPGLALSSEDFKVTDWMFEGLVRFKGESTDIEPALAQSWEVTPDGKVWTFKLRPGVKFHDGSPLNAAAVKYSFERQFKKDHPHYSARFARWASKFGDMTGADAIDDMTVRLNFTVAQPALLQNLAIYVGYVVSQAAASANPQGFSTNPSGTGPYKFVRWEKNNLIELARNDAYWGGPAKVERVVVRVIPENDVRLLALQKGEIHLTDDLPFNRLAEVAASSTMAVHTVPAYGFSGIYFNLQSKTVGDVRVRQAINHAINRGRIFNVTFFKQGVSADQALPAGSMGYVKNIPAYAYDPDKAKKLLNDAGVAAGTKVNLLAFANPRPFFPSPTDAVAMVKADLARVGIDLNVNMATWADWIAKRRVGEFDMCLGGWTASTLDPDGVLYPLFHSHSIGNDNTARMADPTVDKLLVDARQSLDLKERDRLYQQAASRIADLSAVVFLANPLYSLGMRREVEGAFRNPANQVWLHQVSLR